MATLSQQWQPPNLAELCPDQTSITACSYFGYYFLNFLLNLYNEGDRKEPVFGDCEEDDENSEGYIEEYDFIVVGAGTAGCVLANRLSEVPDWKILLLEAGPEQPEITLTPGLSTVLGGSSIDWGYKPEADGKVCLERRDGKCSWPRGKVMGGSSSINTMVYAKGNKQDFDDWAAAGNEGWGYDDVLPYFRKFENNLNNEALDTKYHGTKGPQYISRFPYIDAPSIALTTAFYELGLPLVDFNGPPPQIGTSQAQAFSKSGKRVSVNTAYIEPIRYVRKNLVIKTMSQVNRILIDKTNTAYGVRYVRNGKTYTAIAKKEVIVSGGAVNSPQLLMLSGIGPRKHLEEVGIPLVADLPVGQEVQDHVTFTGIIIAFDNRTSTVVPRKQMLKEIEDYEHSEIKSGPMSSTGPYNSVSFFSTTGSDIPDIQIQTASIIWREYIKEPVLFMETEIFPSVYYDAVIPRLQNIYANSRGQILLNASNPYGDPVMYGNYFSDETDMLPIKRGMKVLLRLEDTDTFKSGRARYIKVPLEACKHTIWGTDDYVECMCKHYTFALNHQAGTCKMGRKSDKATVDSRLRVYEVSRLRVIDASIMPRLVRGNTNAATLMIAEKGSDLIKEDWKKYN